MRAPLEVSAYSTPGISKNAPGSPISGLPVARKHDAALMDRLFQHTSGMHGNLFIVIKYRSVQIQSDHANLRFHMFCLLFSVATVL